MKKVNDYAAWHVIAQFLFERFRASLMNRAVQMLQEIFSGVR